MDRPQEAPSWRLNRVRAMLERAGLRQTRQRVALADLLFARGNRHVSADSLHEEAIAANVPVSVATIYNTLNQFSRAGLIREVGIDGSRTYFDTNVAEHHHFYFEDDQRLEDIPATSIQVEAVGAPPAGYEVARVDTVVRLRRRSG
jgi:Fur family iron response transcriptional regulator